MMDERTDARTDGQTWATLNALPHSTNGGGINISSTSGPITMKFYQKHHWDGEKAALGFGPDRI